MSLALLALSGAAAKLELRWSVGGARIGRKIVELAFPAVTDMSILGQMRAFQTERFLATLVA